jgi:hypothetical protein
MLKKETEVKMGNTSGNVTQKEELGKKLRTNRCG